MARMASGVRAWATQAPISACCAGVSRPRSRMSSSVCTLASFITARMPRAASICRPAGHDCRSCRAKRHSARRAAGQHTRAGAGGGRPDTRGHSVLGASAMPFHARRACALAAALVLGAPLAHAATPLSPCRIDGIPNELQCGSLQRPLDPTRPDGAKLDIHYLVVPAMARNKQPDAVLMLAGGPGQSAIGIAARVLPRLARLNNRRDLVFIDQRGTGKSAPLECADDSKRPVAEQLEGAAQMRQIDACREALQQLPYGKDGGLGFFTTTLAMQDMDAVR
ncbi:hypothetical protein DBR42_30100, partial [Pelomonas sp. HMWF004]